ncbi:uncharacterized protein PSFLO_07507 [Pseudozyma flocculosa]|uniref:Uncharacterized protein n=1 Tax=Pseudozyma flocculosa TaxID=84751 RepID=A0A5C3FC50_9BASI|nr:uncharacterized protein PSFLO_07507 [Pseudozyma flocculosa]
MVDLTPLSLIASRLRCHIHEIGHRRAAGSPASAPTTEPGWPPPRPDRTVGPRSDDVDDDRDERTSTTFCSLLAVGVAASASARSPTIQLASQPASYPVSHDLFSIFRSPCLPASPPIAGRRAACLRFGSAPERSASPSLAARPFASASPFPLPASVADVDAPAPAPSPLRPCRSVPSWSTVDTVAGGAAGRAAGRRRRLRRPVAIAFEGHRDRVTLGLNIALTYLTTQSHCRQRHLALTPQPASQSSAFALLWHAIDGDVAPSMTCPPQSAAAPGPHRSLRIGPPVESSVAQMDNHRSDSWPPSARPRWDCLAIERHRASSPPAHGRRLAYQLGRVQRAIARTAWGPTCHEAAHLPPRPAPNPVVAASTRDGHHPAFGPEPSSTRPALSGPPLSAATPPLLGNSATCHPRRRCAILASSAPPMLARCHSESTFGPDGSVEHAIAPTADMTTTTTTTTRSAARWHRRARGAGASVGTRRHPPPQARGRSRKSASCALALPQILVEGGQHTASASIFRSPSTPARTDHRGGARRMAAAALPCLDAKPRLSLSIIIQRRHAARGDAHDGLTADVQTLHPRHWHHLSLSLPSLLLPLGSLQLALCRCLRSSTSKGGCTDLPQYAVGAKAQGKTAIGSTSDGARDRRRQQARLARAGGRSGRKRAGRDSLSVRHLSSSRDLPARFPCLLLADSACLLLSKEPG